MTTIRNETYFVAILKTSVAQIAETKTSTETVTEISYKTNAITIKFEQRVKDDKYHSI